jgi:hypothetical protein
VKLWDRVLRRSVPELVRFACVLALLALGLVCWSVLDPRPVPVILAMSAGHVVGGSAFAFYLLAVILDAVRRPPPTDHEAVFTSVASAPADAAKQRDSSASPQTTNQS